MLMKADRKTVDYAELEAWQEIAWWATHYLSMVAVAHYGYDVDEIKTLSDAERAIWDFTWQLGKQKLAEADSPDRKREALDVFYGSIQYWRDCGPAYWEKHAELDKAFDMLRRELL